MFSSVCEGFSRTKPEFRRVVYWKCKPFKWKWKFYVKLFSQLSFCVQLRKKYIYISQTMFWLLLIISSLQFKETIRKKNVAGLAFYVVFWVHQQRPPCSLYVQGVLTPMKEGIASPAHLSSRIAVFIERMYPQLNACGQGKPSKLPLQSEQPPGQLAGGSALPRTIQWSGKGARTAPCLKSPFLTNYEMTAGGGEDGEAWDKRNPAFSVGNLKGKFLQQAGSFVSPFPGNSHINKIKHK